MLGGRSIAMPQHDRRIGVTALGFVPARAILLRPLAVMALLWTGSGRPAWAVIDIPGDTLARQCAMAHAITVLRVEKVNREKKGIVYRKVRDLKGDFPAPRKFVGDTFTHVLRENPNPTWHRQDIDNQDRQNEAILAWAAEGKTVVIFQRGAEQAICVGHAWYTARSIPPDEGHWVEAAGADSRMQRLFCGDVDELIAAIPSLLAGKDTTVPHMIGTMKMLSEHTGPIRGISADKLEPQREFYSPFHGQAPWCTHRGNAQRTGADDGAGPQEPKTLWAYSSQDDFVAPLVPSAQEVFTFGLGAFNTCGLRSLSLDPRAARRLRWSKSCASLESARRRGACAGAQPHVDVDVRRRHAPQRRSKPALPAAGDGLPLWRLPVSGKLVHFEGTPTVTATVRRTNSRHVVENVRKLFVGGGSAGMLCLNPFLVTLDGKEQDLWPATGVLEQRWRELLAKYEVDVKKDPMFTPRPNELMLPKSAPKLLWQQGKDQWHVDAPVAVVEDLVLAASAYLDDEKSGERALVCLKADDGSVVWKTPLKFNPWAGPTIGPYILVGCSSIRLEPDAIPGARGEVVAVDLDTGAVRWRKELPGGVLSSIAVQQGLAIFTATDGKVRALDAHTGEARWTYDAKGAFFAGPAVTANTVYAADLKGVVHAIRAADGKPQWSLDLAAAKAPAMIAPGMIAPGMIAPGMIYGSPLVHGGRLYLATCNLGQEQDRRPSAVLCIGEK